MKEKRVKGVVISFNIGCTVCFEGDEPNAIVLTKHFEHRHWGWKRWKTRGEYNFPPGVNAPDQINRPSASSVPPPPSRKTPDIPDAASVGSSQANETPVDGRDGSVFVSWAYHE